MRKCENQHFIQLTWMRGHKVEPKIANFAKLKNFEAMTFIEHEVQHFEEIRKQMSSHKSLFTLAAKKQKYENKTSATI